MAKTPIDRSRARRDWPAVPIPTPDEVYGGVAEQAKQYPLFLESIVRQSENFKKPENLGRIGVLDLSKGMIIGSWCSSMFSELGAETIKAEPPDGDPLRWQTPFGRKEYILKDVESGEPIGLHFLHEMRNKQSITLDLETLVGRDILRQLVVHFDVLIENYPPGQFDEWGIGYRQLKEINPRLVYAWVGQLGQWGPMKDKPGMLDPTAQAACGFVHGTGHPKEFEGGPPARPCGWPTTLEAPQLQLESSRPCFTATRSPAKGSSGKRSRPARASPVGGPLAADQLPMKRSRGSGLGRSDRQTGLGKARLIAASRRRSAGCERGPATCRSSTRS